MSAMENQPATGSKLPPIRAFDVAVAVVCAVALILFFLGSKVVQDNEVDDAGITFNFARNLAQGFGIVLYPGGERVEGYSNPSWMFLLAGAIKLGMGPFAAAKFLAYLLGAGTLILLGLMAARALPDRPSYALLAAPLLLAAHGTYLIWSFSGMETVLQVFLMTAGAYRLFRESDPDNQDRLPVAPLLYFALAITRPEAIGYFALAIGYRALAYNIRGRTLGLRDLIWLAAFFAPWGLYQLWHHVYFAWPLPNTFYAKVHVDRSLSDILSTSTNGGRYVIDYIAAFKLKPLFLLAPFALLSRKGWPSTLFFAGTLAFALFFPMYANGDWMDGYRFCTPAAMPLFVLAALGVQGIANGVGWFLRNKPAAKTAVAATLAGVFLTAALAWLVPTSKVLVEKHMKRPPARIRGLAKRAEFYREKLDRLRFQDFEATILDMDMGGLSLTSRMKIIDVGRLCDVPYAQNYADLKNRRRFAEQYVLNDRRPEIVHVRRGWGRATGLLGNPNFHTNYIELPDSRLFGPGESGNFIRRDLVYVERPENADVAYEVHPGLSLIGSWIEIEPIAPGDTAHLRLIWQRDSEESLPDLKFEILLEDHDGKQHKFEPYSPVMGWLPTSKWERGKPIGEWVDLKMSKKWRPGTYKVYLKIHGPGDWESIPPVDLAVAMTVNKESKIVRLRELFDDALAKAESQDLDGAIEQYRRAVALRNGPLMKKWNRAFEKSLCNAAIEKSAPFMQSEPERAALLLLTARERFPRNKKLNGFLWQLSDAEYEKGEAVLASDGPCAAFSRFDRAVKWQPLNSWARRRAEQTRPYCY
jgi:hypothetical protein